MLNGTQVRTLEDFWRLIGEAVNGPGGYFGKNLDAFADCLSGGFGSPTMTTRLLNGVTTRRLASIWAIRRRLASWRFASHGAIPRTVLLSARIWLRRMHSTG
ncbi:barstar family protein [Streptomyces hokutonensis]|uniref:barstar family protein n=1 Tax=Streptomyces hokutonensis TaxID=1306990 RepID=UPI0036C97CBD